MKTALLISTYNWSSALDLIFEALKRQTRLPDEILIADDGSQDDTRQLIYKFKEEITVPVKHFWHEDRGFRKASILNQALAKSDADYIIQIDGDCIPERHFIEDHLSRVESGVYLYGSRVNIREEYVPEVLKKQKMRFQVFSKGILRRTRALRIPFLAFFYRPKEGVSSKVRGCNLSFWRKDFIAINGYNEDFEGWGREDSEMVVRLNNNHVKGKRLRYCGIVFHLGHKIESRGSLEKNDRIEQTSKAEQIVRIQNGIDKYL